jgi:hypothetical protein
MTVRRPALPATAAIACGAGAFWVSLGAIAFTDPSAPSTRVGLLPPLSWLAALLGLAVATAIFFGPAHRRVAALWLSAVLFLPWLPVRLPFAVFMWIGGLRWWLWAAIGTTLAVPIVRDRRAARIGRVFATPASAVPLAAVLAALLFGAGAWAVAPRLPTGDEPHYLILAQSLLRDGDIQIENNHTQEDYHTYFSSTLRPDYVRRGLNGAIYSIHAPGLPALVTPAFAIFGYRGVQGELILLTACATALVWSIGWRLTGQAGASWFGWAAVTCSAPLFFHAFSVYPDTLGAGICALGVWPLVDDGARRPRRLLVVALAIAALPWLHTRFAILAAVLTLVIAARIVRMPDAIARLSALCILPLLSAAAWFLFFWTIYGSPNPAGPYGGGTQDGFAFMPAGLAGLLFDQQFGVIPNAPVFLCIALGFVAMGRHGHRRLAVELLAIVVPYFLVVAAFPMWWAGYSAPSRFLVVLSLLFGVPAAVWFATRKTQAARIAGVALLLLSALITLTIASVDRGAMLFNTRNGFSLLLLGVAPVVDLTRGLPSSFPTPPSIATFHAAIWLLALAVPVIIAIRLERRGWARTQLVVLIGLGWAMTTMSATTLVWRHNGVTNVVREAGGIELLRRYDPARAQVAFSYPPLHRIAAAQLPPRITLARTAAAVGHGEELLLFVLQPVAGVYEVEGVTTSGGSGHIRVRLDRQLPGIDEWDLSSSVGPWRRVIRLPVSADVLRLDGDVAARRSVHGLSIRAIELPGHAIGYAPDLVAIHGTRYGPALVFQTGGAASMEPAGAWVHGEGFADFVIVPAADAPVRLFVRNGGAGNHVTVDGGSWREELTLSAGEERWLALPAEARRVVAVRVKSESGARPADSDPQTSDRRLLGCWIETR